MNELFSLSLVVETDYLKGFFFFGILLSLNHTKKKPVRTSTLLMRLYSSLQNLSKFSLTLSLCYKGSSIIWLAPYLWQFLEDRLFTGENGPQPYQCII